MLELSEAVQFWLSLLELSSAWFEMYQNMTGKKQKCTQFQHPVMISHCPLMSWHMAKNS
jgi:hypothetical protein